MITIKANHGDGEFHIEGTTPCILAELNLVTAQILNRLDVSDEVLRTFMEATLWTLNELREDKKK